MISHKIQNIPPRIIFVPKPMSQSTEDSCYDEANNNDRQSISTVTNGSEEDELIRIYQFGLGEEENTYRKEQVSSIIKQRIWPTTKFTSHKIIQETKLMEEGNFLSEILHGMNMINYSKTKRARFWNTYGKHILPELSKQRCNVQQQMKNNVLKGEIFVCNYRCVILM